MKYLSMIIAALLPLTLSAQTKLSDLIEGTTIVATDLIPFVDVSDTTQAASGSTKKATAQTLINELAQLIAPTWNNGATDFTAIKVNVTNTASGAGSKLLDLQVGGSSLFQVDKTGSLTWSGTAVQPANTPLILGVSGGSSYGVVKVGSTGFYVEVNTVNSMHVRADGAALISTGSYAFTSGGPDGTRDLFLYRHAANTLAQRNGTNAQEFRLYNTYDGTNDEWLYTKWGSNVAEIGTAASGTGALRELHVNASILRAGSASLVSSSLSLSNVPCLTWNGARFYIGESTVPLVMGGTIFRFNGDSASFPAIKRSGTTIQSRLADDSAFAPVQGKLTTDTNATTGTITADKYLILYDAAGTAYRVPCVAD